jgi:hypothetical protein
MKQKIFICLYFIGVRRMLYIDGRNKTAYFLEIRASEIYTHADLNAWASVFSITLLII